MKDIDVSVELPKGYKIKRESKTARTSIVMRPTYLLLLNDVAARKGMSRNDLLNNIIEDYIDEKVIEERKQNE